MKTQDRILEAIYRSALKFLSPLNPDETYKTILNEAIKLVKADSGAIHLYIQKEFKVVYASLEQFYTIAPRRKGHTFQAFVTKKPVISGIDDIKRAHKELRNLQIKSAIFIPLSNKNKSIGVLALNSGKEEYFSSRELEILKLFGSLASLAIVKSQLYDEVNKALGARDLLISMTAHELRTPITTISGYIQLLQSRLSGVNVMESRWIKELRWESQRLALLVNELLEVERIKAGQFLYHFRECSLRAILSQVLKDFGFNHPDHKIIQIDKVEKNDDRIIGDFDKLLRVINNLLDNAAKFSLPEQVITITLKPQLRNIILSIKDKGIGIPGKDMPYIFEKFYRIGNHSREGMGLGLFLAKSIISQHDGIISIKSKENTGTTVSIKLPKAKYGIKS